MIWTYTFIPLLALIVGAALTVLRTPSRRFEAPCSILQQAFFAAAAGELLPDLKHHGHLLSVVAGGGLGVALMLAVLLWNRLFVHMQQQRG